jgi:FkbM family methyltransferase
MLRQLSHFFHQRILRRQAQDGLGGLRLGPSDVAIDCGANVGEVTALLSAAGATVYAFEPNPHAFAKLARRFAGQPNVHCIQQGVLDRHDRMRLYLHKQAARDEVKWSTGSSLLAEKSNVDRERSVEVEVIDLSEFIERLGRPVTLLKLDVEGVECRILRKLIDTGVSEKITHILVETHDAKMPELKAETDALRAAIAERGLRNIRLDWV